MKLQIFIILLFLPSSLLSQSETEIISVMKKYTSSDKFLKSHQFVDEKLNPALANFQKIMCSKPSNNLLDNFLTMLLNSKGSADEFRTYVFAEVFVCHPDMVEDIILSKYRDYYLVEELEFGYSNIDKSEIKNSAELLRRIILMKRATSP